MTHARVTSWGVNLLLLQPAEQCLPVMETGEQKATMDAPLWGEDYLRSWLKTHQIETRAADHSLAWKVLRAAYAIAWWDRAKQLNGPAPRPPLLHNQRCGVRYLLQFDETRAGSPADFHILVYSLDSKPTLRVRDTMFHEAADEHKPGLLLFASNDARVRFYQPTADQWADWKSSWPGVEHLPEQIRAVVSDGVDAAATLESSRQRVKN